MLRFTERPGGEARTKFEDKAAESLAAIHGMKDAAGNPKHAEIKEHLDSKELWGNMTLVKRHFYKIQNGKCGYCERMVTGYGDIEHYWPKKAVQKLKERGVERPYLHSTLGRKYFKYPEKGAYDSGYWWLAYSWDNFMLACKLCNQAWKSALFPVRYGHRRRPKEGDEKKKDPYVLDPYGSRDPAEHLAFTKLGAVRALTRYGTETIEVCGLWRPSVIRSRLEKAKKVYQKIAQFLEVSRAGGDTRLILEDIFELGDERWIHAGMVRIMYTQLTAQTWDALREHLRGASSQQATS